MRDEPVTSMRKRNLPEEWGGVVPTEVFIDETLRLVGRAEKKGITLRILGGLGIRLHSKGSEEFAKKLSRAVEAPDAKRIQEYTDLDLISYWKENKRISEFLTSNGYVKRRATLGDVSLRQIYYHPQGWFHVDIFYDAIKMNHDVPFKGRLELDYPTATATDLLLTKLQIVSFAEKDLKDCWLLLRSHEISSQEGDCISGAYVAKLLSKDWGFWYTATNNLRGIRSLAAKSEVLNGVDKEDIQKRARSLMERIDAEPKSLAWKSRAILGSKIPWYRQVESEATVGEFGIWRLG